MVERQIVARGVQNPAVLEAMNHVPRHEFVADCPPADAYGDHPLSIGFGQTISQPYIVAFSVEALELPEGARVLEVGTGCGYQAAVLSEAGFDVWTIEIVAELARQAQETLGRLGYSKVRIRAGDGHAGWPEEAPFDGIVCAAAADDVPRKLLAQLSPEGRMIVPIGSGAQSLWRFRRTPAGIVREELMAVRFVPMTGTD